MGIKQDIEKALKEAMRSGAEARKKTFRLILSSVKLAEVEIGRELDDPAMLAVIQKEIKIRRESIEGAQQANRPNLIQETNEELAILEEFLPKQLSDTELTELALAAIQETNAINIADTGKVMKALMPRVQGRAPGDRVSQVVRTVLQNRS